MLTPFCQDMLTHSSLHPGSTEYKWISSKLIFILPCNSFVQSLLKMHTQTVLGLVALTLFQAHLEYGFGRVRKTIISVIGKVERTRLNEFQNNTFPYSLLYLVKHHHGTKTRPMLADVWLERDGWLGRDLLDFTWISAAFSILLGVSVRERENQYCCFIAMLIELWGFLVWWRFF